MRKRLRLYLYGLLAGSILAGTAYAYTTASVNVSKTNGYAVLAPVSNNLLVSKTNGYAVLAPVSNNLLVSKSNGYVVLRSGPVAELVITKTVAYAVLDTLVITPHTRGFVVQ